MTVCVAMSVDGFDWRNSYYQQFYVYTDYKAYCLIGSTTSTDAFEKAGMEVIEINNDLKEQIVEVLDKNDAEVK